MITTRQYKHGVTITMYLSETLVKELDEFIKGLNCSRSSFVEEAIRRCIDYYQLEEVEHGE